MKSFTDVKLEGLVCLRPVSFFEFADATIWFDKLPIDFKISRSTWSGVVDWDIGEKVKILFTGQDPSKVHGWI